jgi:hypothetical protein
MVPGRGYQPENWQWTDELIKSDEGGKTQRRVGRDPMSIPTAVLTAAGHPPRRMSQSLPKFAVTATYVSTASTARGQQGGSSQMRDHQLPAMALPEGTKSS